MTVLVVDEIADLSGVTSEVEELFSTNELLLVKIASSEVSSSEAVLVFSLVVHYLLRHLIFRNSFCSI